MTNLSSEDRAENPSLTGALGTEGGRLFRDSQPGWNSGMVRSYRVDHYIVTSTMRGGLAREEDAVAGVVRCQRGL